MNLLPFVVSWAVLATTVLALALYRRTVANKEDDYLHVSIDVTAQQNAVARKLAVIDKWGKTLTIIVAAYAIVLLGLFMYNGWLESTRVAG